MTLEANVGARLKSIRKESGTNVFLRVPESLLTSSVIAGLIALLMAGSAVLAQEAIGGPSPASALRSHYDAAQAFQANHDFAQAALEYQAFIAIALDRLATVRAGIGDYGKSSALFHEALLLAPNNHALQLDSAEEALASRDLPHAKLLAEKAVAAEPGDVRAHRILGRALLQAGENEQATKELEKAIAIEPDFTNGYALASAYLALKDKKRAANIFREMEASLGDKAALHMQFGLAYGEAGFPEEAIGEFQKTIQEDAKFPGAHYSLGASYLLSMGEIDFPQAVAEFQKELEVNPNDFLSHAQLGYVALSQHRLQDAEGELVRAAALNPNDADVFMSLGQLYVETGRSADAETALRKCIALTSDVSHNHYQVQRAHYLLARVLLQTNRAEDGKREMQISQELLSLSAPHNQGRAHAMSGNDAGEDIRWRSAKSLDQLDSQANDAEDEEKQLGPAIADSYNNMGAIAATSNDFAAATDSFEKAAEWNPTLEGLDYNWGRAAYLGNEYTKAIAPLNRYVQVHPDDTWMRSALGISLFITHDYRQTIQVLEPIASRAGAAPAVSYAYAESLIETGEYASGISQLRMLVANDPTRGSFHRALGEALARQKNYKEAVPELQTAFRLDSSDTEAKINLALVFIQLQQANEAQALLLEMVQKGSNDPDVYYHLGKLQLDRGDSKAAMPTLEKAAKLSPGSELIHSALAAAYRDNSRPDDAAHEMQQADAIHHSRESAAKPSSQN
jgi:tetratricopeptide (TPR) repeat protein